MAVKSFQTLRDFVRPAPRMERCGLCGAELPHGHPHLIEPATRKLVCACTACGLLFSGNEAKYRRIPQRARSLPGFRLTDAQWDGLMIPINMAFFFKSSAGNRVVALYPSPAGPIESLLSLDTWGEISRENPELNAMEPDVEALLVNRGGGEYYLLPIDRCFELVGLIRSHWRGLSGGSDVWEQIGQFFAGLKEERA